MPNTVSTTKMLDSLIHQGKFCAVVGAGRFSKITEIRAQKHVGIWIVRIHAKIKRKIFRAMMQCATLPIVATGFELVYAIAAFRILKYVPSLSLPVTQAT